VRQLLVVVIFVAFGSSLFLSPEARAWGCEGHQTVALVAQKHLNPHAFKVVNQILKGNPIDINLKRYCQPVSANLIVDAATWADDYRGENPNTGDWHFFDIPRGAAQENIDQYCPSSTSCVAAALKDQIAILQTAGADPQKKADALRFIIHFAGDIHQPLHCTTNNDRGANCVPVTYFNARPVLKDATKGNYSPNLHAVWDTNIIGRMAQGKTVDEFAAELDQQFQSKIASWQQEGIDFDGWAWESHQLAEQTSYGSLPMRIAIERPQPVKTCVDDHISERMFELNEQLESEYHAAATPVIQEQLAKAGLRLAMILNRIWP
jgi:hypothetical protein